MGKDIQDVLGITVTEAGGGGWLLTGMNFVQLSGEPRPFQDKWMKKMTLFFLSLDENQRSCFKS